ncbi:10621_t:CDS:2, partial [Funneliformis geosporum]
GTDVLVSIVKASDYVSFYETQLLLLIAAKEASVKRFILSEFDGKFHKYTVESLKIPVACNTCIRVADATLSFNELLKKFEIATVVEDKEVRKVSEKRLTQFPYLMRI